MSEGEVGLRGSSAHRKNGSVASVPAVTQQDPRASVLWVEGTSRPSPQQGRWHGHRRRAQGLGGPALTP